MTVFDGHRTVWQWMFSAQAEGTITAAATTIHQYAGADVLLVKAMDGQAWMSQFDTVPTAISGSQALAAAIAEGTKAGITVVPWVVPHSLADAAAHAAVGPTLVVDLEPYTGFWTDSAANVSGYLAALHAGGVQNVFVSIDPRPSATAALAIDGWAHTVAGLLPQTYWTSFQRPYSECVGYVQTLQGYGVPVYPVLPFDATPSDASGFWQACLALGCTSPQLWRLGSADGAELHTFGQLAVKRTPPPFGDAERWQLEKFNVGGSGPADLIAWLEQFV